MKTNVWKRVWLVGLATLLVGGPTLWAADGRPADRAPRRLGPPPGERPGPGLRRAEQPRPGRPGADLHLTQEQREKMRAAMQAFREEAQKIRQGTQLSPEQRREKMQALREKQVEKMKEILTPEQFEKWQELRNRQGPAAGPGPRPDRPGPRPERRPPAPPADR